MSSAPASPGPDPESRNELRADSYVWFQSTDRHTARSILSVLQEHGVAAYFAVPDGDDLDTGDVIDPMLAEPNLVHIYVDAAETQEARSVGDKLHAAEVGAVDDEPPVGGSKRTELSAAEVDARFAELMAQFDEPDPDPGPSRDSAPVVEERRPVPPPPPPTDDSPQASWRPATSDFLAESDEDDHYVPPPPQPLKRPSRRSALALLILGVGCVLLFFPSLVGLSGTAFAVTGVVLITGGVGLLLMQLRDGPDDPTDDGARI